MLLLLVLILLLWLGGFTLNVGGSLIHLLLAVVLVLAIIDLWPRWRGRP